LREITTSPNADRRFAQKDHLVKPARVRISAEDLKDFVSRLFLAKGMSAADSGSIAEVIVWADQRGAPSHGISRVPMYIDVIGRGDMDVNAVPTIDSRAGAVFVLDGRKAAGAVAMKQAVAEAARRAKAHGIAIGVVSNTTHTGAIGHYVEWAAERGFAAIFFNCGPPNMAYHGTKAPSLGTNPIAIGKLIQARDRGEPIPTDWALTKQGDITSDPALAEILLPLGGAKGSGLAFMFECMTGMLANSPIILKQAGPSGKRRHTANAMMVLIDIAVFRPLDEYKREIGALGALVKSLPKADGFEEVLLPGERGAREFAKRGREGISLSRKSWMRLAEAGEKIGVAAPAVQDI
jgi:ureidoglycolate dehydrogenase (NAD+)